MFKIVKDDKMDGVLEHIHASPNINISRKVKLSSCKKANMEVIRSS